jgi:hypothetical protein
MAGCASDGKSTELLFVQTAHRVSFDNNRMTLHDVSPTTLFFSDRPERITGHQGTAVFLENWSKGSNSFAQNPPNAALVILDDDDSEVAEVVVELENPRLANNNLSYEVTVLEGKIPSSGGVSALFIDAIIVTDPAYIYHDPLVVQPAPTIVYPSTVVVNPAYGPMSYRGQARRVARRTARRVSRRR